MIISSFILLVSLVINGAIDLLINHLLKNFQSVTVIVAYVVNIVVTFLITALVFGLILKVSPDARIKWSHVRVAHLPPLFLHGRKVFDQLLPGHGAMSLGLRSGRIHYFTLGLLFFRHSLLRGIFHPGICRGNGSPIYLTIMRFGLSRSSAFKSLQEQVEAK
jgi:hypothetical protein